MSPYLNNEPRTLAEAMRIIMAVPAMYSSFSPETRKWIKAELNRQAEAKEAA